MLREEEERNSQMSYIFLVSPTESPPIAIPGKSISKALPEIVDEAQDILLLDNPKKHLIFPILEEGHRVLFCIVLPIFGRSSNGVLNIHFFRRIWRTFVKCHNNVSAECMLNFHYFSAVKNISRPFVGARNRTPFFCYFANRSKGKPEIRQNLWAWDHSIPKMFEDRRVLPQLPLPDEGEDETYWRALFLHQFPKITWLKTTFYRSLCSNWHKCRRFYRPMSGFPKIPRRALPLILCVRKNHDQYCAVLPFLFQSFFFKWEIIS